MNRQGMIAAGVVCALGAAGCELVINLRSYEVVDDLTVTAGTGATGASGGTGGAGAAVGAGGSGGTGGAGGAGGNPVVCTPSETEPCYGGPEGTEGIGLCKGGTRICNATGTEWGACDGEVVPVAEVCANEEDDDCDGAACGQTLWAKAFGDVGQEELSAIKLANNGNLLVAGDFDNAINLGGDSLINADGTGRDLMIAELTQQGSHIWSKQLPAESAHVFDLAPSAGGNILLAGRYSGTLQLDDTKLEGAGNGQFGFVAHLAPDGQLLWARELGNTQNVPSICEVAGVAMNGFGDVFIVGSFTGSVDFGTGFLEAGTPYPDVFLAKLDGSTGATVWAKSFGTPLSIEWGRHLAVDTTGNVIIAGAFSDGEFSFGGPNILPAPAGTFGVFVVKFGFDGTHLWTRGAGAPGSAEAWGLSVDSLGGAVVAGAFDGQIDLQGGVAGGKHTSVGQQDIFLVRYGSNGAFDWSTAIGTPGNEAATGVTVTPSGDIVITGTYEQTVDFGGGPLTMPGVGLFWSAFSKDGVYEDARGYSSPLANGGGVLTRVAAENETVFVAGTLAPATDWDWGVGVVGGPETQAQLAALRRDP